MAKPPFQFRIKQVSRRLIEIEFGGYMSEDAEPVATTERIVLASPEAVGLYYEVGTLVGFDKSQIKAHADLLARLGPRVTGIAVRGARAIVRFGAITVSLMSKMPVQTFDSRNEALNWLDTLR
jgi:hypothetical protein